MIDPNDVISPKDRWSLLAVLYKSEEWSLALGRWDNVPRLGARWNGSETPESKGNPVSRGMATWFILPADIAERMMDFVQENQRAWVRDLLEQGSAAKPAPF